MVVYTKYNDRTAETNVFFLSSTSSASKQQYEQNHAAPVTYDTYNLTCYIIVRTTSLSRTQTVASFNHAVAVTFCRHDLLLIRYTWGFRYLYDMNSYTDQVG